jgi:serine/threonine-protein kinase
MIRRVRAPGETIGRYVVEAVLGEGGMGCVYRARDPELGRRVAVKVLRPRTQAGRTAAADDEIVARMRREARAAAALSHPNAVSVFDVGEADGELFIVMELVDGRTLRSYVGAGDVPLARRLRWLADAARALGAAHALGIVHRDIKPDNVMVRPDGLVKVLDFGIARPATSTPDAAGPTAPVGIATVTSEGRILGTPCYMAPEQLLGQALDGRTDQFAWGVMAYELLTGWLPWPEDDIARLAVAVVTRAPRSPRALVTEIPEHVEGVVLRALEKLPEARFASIDEAADALERFAEPRAGASPQASPGATERTTVRMEPIAVATDRPRIPPIARAARHRRLALGLATVIGLVVVAGMLLPRQPAPAGRTLGAGTLPRRGGLLRVGLVLGRGSFDLYPDSDAALSSIALGHVVTPLVVPDLDGNGWDAAVDVAPGADAGADEKAFVLTLREGVRFHAHPCLGPSRDARAADVAYSLNLALRRHMFLPILGAADVRAGRSAAAEGIGVVDERRLSLALSAPVARLERLLIVVALVPDGLERCEDVRALRHPVGTGPFRFEALREDAIVLAATDVPPERRATRGPHVERFELRSVATVGEALPLLVQGALDILVTRPEDAASLLEGAGHPLAALAPQYRDAGLRLATVASPRSFGLFGLFPMPGRDGPLRVPLVRRAIARALDPEALYQALAGRFPTRLVGAGRFLAPWHIGHDVTLAGSASNEAAARRLLAEAGHPGGRGLAPVRVVARADRLPIAQAVAKQLERVGIRLEIFVTARQGAEEAIAERRVDGFVGRTHGPGGADPDLILRVSLQGMAFAGVESAALERLLEAALGARDEARARAYRAVEERLLEEVPFIPLGFTDLDEPVELYVVRSAVRGLADPLTGRITSLPRPYGATLWLEEAP